MMPYGTGGDGRDGNFSFSELLALGGGASASRDIAFELIGAGIRCGVVVWALLPWNG